MAVSAQTQRINGQHPLEMRLREKIDFLSDQRDDALKEMWAAKERCAELERKLHNTRCYLYQTRISRNKWRRRWQELNRCTKHLRRYWKPLAKEEA